LIKKYFWDYTIIKLNQSILKKKDKKTLGNIIFYFSNLTYNWNLINNKGYLKFYISKYQYLI
jgi:hypothetical protein